MDVELMDYDPGPTDDSLGKQTTDANGNVTFSSNDLNKPAGNEKPDLYFKAHPKARIVGSNKLPDSWKSKGWLDASGRPGYYDDFTGTSLGSPTDPLTFRIGF